MFVSAVCALAATALFVTTTLPAIGENRELRRLEEDHQRLAERLAREHQDLRDRTWALDRDPQALLMEIDRAGLVPAELPSPVELPSLDQHQAGKHPVPGTPAPPAGR